MFDDIIYTEKQDKERYNILGLDWKADDWGMGGTISFNNLKLNKLKELVDKGYIFLDERQNDAPTTADFIKILENHPDFHAHGYLVVNKRDDRRISIEGIESDTTYSTDAEYEEAESITNELVSRINNMGYYVEECGVYYDDAVGGSKIWLWWD